MNKWLWICHILQLRKKIAFIFSILGDVFCSSCPLFLFICQSCDIFPRKTHFVIFGRNRRNNMEKRRVFVCLFVFFLMWGIDILGSNAYEQIVSTGFFRNCRVMYDSTYLPNVRHKTPEKPGDGEFFYPLEVHSYLSPVLLYEKWNWGPGKFQQYFNIPRFIPLHHIYIV